MKRKENLFYWNENFVLLDLDKSMSLKKLSIQACSNKENIEKYEYQLFFKSDSIFGNGVSINYEHDEEEGVTDSEIFEIFELVFTIYEFYIE